MRCSRNGVVAADVVLDADLTLPDAIRGLVVLVRGPGQASDHAALRALTSALADRDLATLRLALATSTEEERGVAQPRDATRRLIDVIDGLRRGPDTAHAPLGLFVGEEQGVIAAAAAAARPADVRALVVLGGPPRAGHGLPPASVASILFLVGDDRGFHAGEAGAHTIDRVGDFFTRHLQGDVLAPARMPLGSVPTFHDRRDAGRRLGAALAAYAGRDDVVVLGIPRGGIPVADETARALVAPLGVVRVARLRPPGSREGVVATLGPEGVLVVEGHGHHFAPEELSPGLLRARLRLRRHEGSLGLAAPELAGKTVIIVDDTMFTGSSMRAAVAWARVRLAARVVVAVPTAPAAAVHRLALEANEVICLATSAEASKVGRTYVRRRRITEAEVSETLANRGATLAAPRNFHAT